MPTITKQSYLVVNGVTLATPAWWITDLDPAMLRDSDVRGEDRIIPGAAGVRPKKRRRTVTIKQFEMVIVGEFDQNGSPYADPRMGLIINVEYLKANLGLAYATGDGTVTAVWHRYNGSTTTGSVHVTKFDLDDLDKRHVKAVLELSIPTGVFT